MGAVSVFLPFELEAKVREQAKKRGTSLSQIVVEALETYFKKVEGGGTNE